MSEYNIERSQFVEITKNYEVMRFGNNYGGFGVYSDIFNDLNKEIVVFSFGIGEDLSFSESIMEKYNAKIYAFDPTPKSIRYVERHDLFSNENFSFFPIGLSSKDERVIFHLPENEEYVSGSVISHKGVKNDGIEVEMKCLNTIVKNENITHIDILKMDIEGSEFNVIDTLDTLSIEIKQICVEVHDRFFEDGLKKLERFNKKLHSMGYLLIATAENGLELTYVKESLLNSI